MLTALELYGFKSFPDRTRFEFPPGITVIVGPNGSGKSNIVDGIKWVLGEQSAKSLRGKEMADVIFKGTTGSGGRKPNNTAEASLFFDNTSRRLPLDSDEICITRRVYRSGEGEYQINGEPCRLKDIRNLVRGTGVGADAYSLIEQGKVDQLLQASPRERRAIFEEAAGISRFKAKKIEAERRLGRVEQNLVRLADIVEEVGDRYRKIQSQATKAAKYKKHTERLQALRTHVGAKDWRDFSKHLTEIEGEKNQFIEVKTENQELLSRLEQESRSQEVLLSEWSSKILEFQQTINELIQQITESQSNIALHQSRTDDLKVQASAQREILSRIDSKTEELLERFEASLQQMDSTKELCGTSEESLTATDAAVNALQGEIKALELAINQKKSSQTNINSLVSELGKQLSAAESRRTVTTATNEKLIKKMQQLESENAEKQRKLQEHLNAQQSLQNEAAAKDSALQDAQSSLQQLRGQLKEAGQQLSEKRRKQTGATERAEVIQELENRLEGVDSGVKELLEKTRTESDPWLQDIRGLVADVIKVNVQHAELVDLALGDFARCLIVEGPTLVDRLAAGQLKPSGRLRVIQLGNPPTLGTRPGVDLGNEEGVVGRLDQLVQVEPEYQPLAARMLGGTFLVKTLLDALRLLKKKPGLVRFVTLQAEILEADGTLIAGPKTAGSGIVSRRSELRALHREIHNRANQIREDAGLIEQLQQKADHFDAVVNGLLNENTELATRLNAKAAAANALEQQIQTLRAEQQQLKTETSDHEQEIQTLDLEIGKLKQSLTENESHLAQLESFLTQSEQQLSLHVENLNRDRQQQTTLKVQLAKAQQQHEDATQNNQRLQQQREENDQNTVSTRSTLAGMLWQQRSSGCEIKESTRSLTALETQRTGLDSELKQLTDQRGQADARRKEISGQLGEARSQAQNAKDRLHEIELRESQLSMERTQLAQRLLDDYAINVSELDTENSEIDEDRDAIDKEITDLRRKIGNIGSVNMDALVELEEMQQRFEALDAQYQDLVMAREALEKIIQKINNDSRRLFEETLQAIRSNFQILFRQTFGGGQADLVFDEDVDILEAGIDIMATPPGKPEFSNSLLSGGERALTAVSLLMAIFQFRPSPFCVLDEVDAPFDEANVGRFIDVLKSFLDWTKFVIVTHSKVTMTAATTLYGVTMQESGVSKKVSVRFEDVNEDGEISEDAINRDSGDEKVA